MKKQFIFVVGGARSGKSSFALRAAEEIGGSKAFVATCPVLDTEMADRVRRHQEERAGRGWSAVEEPVAIDAALDRLAGFDVVLIDCLTLWVNNLMYEAEKAGTILTEDVMAATADRLLAAIGRHPGTVVAVANEVGLGIVPDNPVARLFRDVAGRANQIMAAGADSVYFLACGIPCKIKG